MSDINRHQAITRARAFLRRFVASDATDVAETTRRLDVLSRQVAELRGLLFQQTDFTVEALRRAGWQSEDEAAQQTALRKTLDLVKSDEHVVAGPWTGEVGFELLYWIPFLNWLADQGLNGRRMIVISRGGAAAWYRHLSARYVDALDLVSPEEFRTRTAGPKKQYEKRSEFDRELVKKACLSLGLGETPVIHPSVMYRLFSGLWRRRSTINLAEAFTTYRELTPSEPAFDEDTLKGLPPDYLAMKFYFSKAFPETTANRRFVAELLRDVSREAPVVLLSTSLQLDEHRDFQASGGSRVVVVDAHTVPQKNLELQTRIISGARGFIGTYGGFSYLAPFYGVRSLSFFSRRFGFETHHLELADRVFDRLLPGGFAALDRRAIDLVAPAIGRWTKEEVKRQKEKGKSEERVDVEVSGV